MRRYNYSDVERGTLSNGVHSKLNYRLARLNSLGRVHIPVWCFFFFFHMELRWLWLAETHWVEPSLFKVDSSLKVINQDINSVVAFCLCRECYWPKFWLNVPGKKKKVWSSKCVEPWSYYWPLLAAFLSPVLELAFWRSAPSETTYLTLKHIVWSYPILSKHFYYGRTVTSTQGIYCVKLASSNVSQTDLWSRWLHSVWWLLEGGSTVRKRIWNCIIKLHHVHSTCLILRSISLKEPKFCTSLVKSRQFHCFEGGSGEYVHLIYEPLSRHVVTVDSHVGQSAFSDWSMFPGILTIPDFLRVFTRIFFFVFAFVFVCLWDSHTSVILLVIGPCSFRTNVSGKVSIYGIFCVYTLQRVQYFEYLFCAVCRKRCEMYSTPSTVLHSEVRTINCTSHSTHNALSFRLS